ncbi:hypothetical protein BH23CHL8_BH23CHL8_06710 [soil metagenome]
MKLRQTIRDDPTYYGDFGFYFACPVPGVQAGDELVVRVKLWRKLHPRDKLHLRTRPVSVVPENCAAEA